MEYINLINNNKNNNQRTLFISKKGEKFLLSTRFLKIDPDMNKEVEDNYVHLHQWTVNGWQAIIRMTSYDGVIDNWNLEKAIEWASTILEKI